MVQAFAAYERALIRTRTSAVLRALRARGQRAGEIPLGYRLAEDGKGLLEGAGGIEAIDRARKPRAEGLPFAGSPPKWSNSGCTPGGQGGSP